MQVIKAVLEYLNTPILNKAVDTETTTLFEAQCLDGGIT
jgi:hypothetical protein